MSDSLFNVSLQWAADTHSYLVHRVRMGYLKTLYPDRAEEIEVATLPEDAFWQDAHVVVFIYRDEYYNPDTQNPGTAEFLVEKNRNGSTGMVRMVWIGEQTAFRSMVRQEIML